jgi:hypothetical protein
MAPPDEATSRGHDRPEPREHKSATSENEAAALVFSVCHPVATTQVVTGHPGRAGEAESPGATLATEEAPAAAAHYGHPNEAEGPGAGPAAKPGSAPVNEKALPAAALVAEVPRPAKGQAPERELVAGATSPKPAGLPEPGPARGAQPVSPMSGQPAQPAVGAGRKRAGDTLAGPARSLGNQARSLGNQARSLGNPARSPGKPIGSSSSAEGSSAQVEPPEAERGSGPARSVGPAGHASTSRPEVGGSATGLGRTPVSLGGQPLAAERTPRVMPAGGATAKGPSLAPEHRATGSAQPAQKFSHSASGPSLPLAAPPGAQANAVVPGPGKLVGTAPAVRAQATPEQLGQVVLRELAQLPPAAKDDIGNWSMSVQLDPPELGRVDATLTLLPAGLHVLLVASTAAGHAALQQFCERISVALGGTVTVSSNSNASGGPAAGQDGAGRGTAHGSAFGNAEGPNPGDGRDGAPARTAAHGADGGIYLFV